jgi:hypothetical protein
MANHRAPENLRRLAERSRHLAEYSSDAEAVQTFRQMANQIDAALPMLEVWLHESFGGQLDGAITRPSGEESRRAS